ncbi:MAG: hypothetical protein Q9183_005254 [Haloplaca sp. 2 TL-2023]
MLYSKILSTLITAVSLAQCLPSERQIPLGQTSRPTFTRDFDDYVTQLLSDWHVPGLSIAVVDGDETFTKGYGTATFPSVNVTPATLFYTGSTTKAFTAAALALLIDDSANSSQPITWRTPISSLIRDDFVIPDEYATAHVTLEDAASHRTGMPRHDASYGRHGSELRDVVRNLRNLPMTAEIRTRFQYCNMMFMTLSHVIETLTRSWLGDTLWERIWKPLDMTRTYFSLDQAKEAVENGTAQLATGYSWNNHTEKYIESEWMDIPIVSGAGNIISNVEDYARWLRFLIDQSPPLSQSGHMALRHARTVLEDQILPGFTGVSTYALGWNVENYRGEPFISHGGSTPGFGALVGYLPQRRYGFAMMGNSVLTSNIAQIILQARLLDDFLDVPSEKRGDTAAVVEKALLKPQIEKMKDPIKALYPNAPIGKHAIPLSRSLSSHTGIYHNKGYKNITITLSQGQETLSAKSSQGKHLHSGLDASFVSAFDFIHVTGEFFVVMVYPDSADKHQDDDQGGSLETQVVKGEFRMGEDGEIAEFGVGLEPEMGEEKIWFRKIAAAS